MRRGDLFSPAQDRIREARLAGSSLLQTRGDVRQRARFLARGGVEINGRQPLRVQCPRRRLCCGDARPRACDVNVRRGCHPTPYKLLGHASHRVTRGACGLRSALPCESFGDCLRAERGAGWRDRDDHREGYVITRKDSCQGDPCLRSLCAAVSARRDKRVTDCVGHARDELASL